MIRFALGLAMLLTLCSPAVAYGCSIILPPLPEMAKNVATTNVIIRGTVIQAFDAKKEQPEIIRAEHIYIGDPNIRTFVIFRSKDDYSPDPRAMNTSCYVPRPSWKVGDIIDWLFLYPVFSPDGVAENDRWSVNLYANSLLFGEGRRLLVDEAKRAGRYNGDL